MIFTHHKYTIVHYCTLYVCKNAELCKTFSIVGFAGQLK